MQNASGRTRLSSRGRIVIPKDIRKQLGLVEGQELSLVAEGSMIYLTPVAKEPRDPSLQEGSQAHSLKERSVADGWSNARTSIDGADTPTTAELVRRVKAVDRLQTVRKQIAGRHVDWETLWAQAQADRK